MTQKVLVLGKGKSGNAAKEMLKGEGFFVRQVSDETKPYLAKTLKTYAFAVVSPGFSPQNKWVLACKSANLKLVSELDLGLSRTSSKNIVAVTGTNGKTTTCSLIASFLQTQKNTHLLGNIGTPICEKAKTIRKNDFVVLEVSSFMLAQSERLNPKIAIISNILPDHIEWHGSTQAYTQAKLKILGSSNGVAIVDSADPLLPLYKANSKAKLFQISTKHKVLGAYIHGKNIFWNDGNIHELVAKRHQINLFGNHNLKNALMAICAAKLCGISNENIQKALQNFNGLPHRIQKVACVRGVTFVNDSKSTNVSSTLSAVQSFGRKRPIVLVGGYDKMLEVGDLFKYLKHRTKHIVLFGAAGERFLKVAKKCGCKRLSLASNLKSAFQIATKKAKKGDVVLLSPACSSFDEFSSFEQRGERFEQLVKEFESCEKVKCTPKNTV